VAGARISVARAAWDYRGGPLILPWPPCQSGYVPAGAPMPRTLPTDRCCPTTMPGPSPTHDVWRRPHTRPLSSAPPPRHLKRDRASLSPPFSPSTPPPLQPGGHPPPHPPPVTSSPSRQPDRHSPRQNQSRRRYFNPLTVSSHLRPSAPPHSSSHPRAAGPTEAHRWSPERHHHNRTPPPQCPSLPHRWQGTMVSFCQPRHAQRHPLAAPVPMPLTSLHFVHR
jgi:hypothetical protein